MSEINELVTEIEQSFVLLKQASVNYDNRYISKVFRELGPLRRKLNKSGNPLEVLSIVVHKSYPKDHQNLNYLTKIVGETGAVHASAPPTASSSEDMEIDSTEVNGNVGIVKASNEDILPEVDLYIHLLIQTVLLDLNQLEKLNLFNDKIIELMNIYNKRSLDFIQAKIWFFIARTKELIQDFYTIRPCLLSALRTSTLRHDDETTASTITLLLRNYLLTHDITQATNLVEKTVFPEQTAGNALVARYYYYCAKIHAIQLDYSSAHECCITLIRKCPQTQLANGFIKLATKLNIVIELLMGDIPELKTFKRNESEDVVSYEPYFEVTKAVKLGDLKIFSEVVNKYESFFKLDDNYTLILRLRQNVIKTGIRIISLAYAKISLKDICIKLHLDLEELTEYIVSKAIRDGVIEASINHEYGFMQSKELLDIYSTKLPQQEFNQRIKFCLSLHSDSVKSMRFPLVNDDKNDSKNGLESKDEEFDLLKAIEEGDLDEFMD